MHSSVSDLIYKSNSLFLLITLLAGCSTQQYSYTPLPAINQSLQDELSVSMIEENRLYLSQTVVSNGEYRDYQEWLKENGDAEARNNSLLDTNSWGQHEPMTRYYHSHPAYSDYPVTTVSQQQARRYCEWKTDRINEMLEANGDFDVKKVVVRLPTIDEWKKAARKGLSDCSVFPWEGDRPLWGPESRHYEGKYRLNYRRTPPVPDGITRGVSFTTPVESYWPSPIGLYNMSGNVAEWVKESGKTKGGAFDQTLYYSRIDAEGLHDGDSSAKKSTGFRYVVEVVKFKTERETEPFEMSTSWLDDHFVPLPDEDTLQSRLYAQTTQVTNKAFRQFLTDNPDADVQIHNDNWKDVSDQQWLQYYGKHEMFDDLPVVNVTYEAAIKYCRWLTEQYNTLPGRQYEEVKFRLPTEDEWEHAAIGGRLYAEFPWGGPFTYNKKGHYLANYHPLDERYSKMNIESEPENDLNTYYAYPGDDKSVSRGLDGGVYTVPVDAYYENDYGLYNMAGNAAEMIQDEGISKGGSWNSFKDNIRIDASENYSDAMPTLGFRVFMEVVEQ